MHELSVVRALIDQLNPYRDRPIKCIELEVGALTCIDADRLQFCFDMVKDKENLVNAELRINTVDAEAKCHQCQQHFRLRHPGQNCSCGSYDYTLLSGQQLLLNRIEFNYV